MCPFHVTSVGRDTLESTSNADPVKAVIFYLWIIFFSNYFPFQKKTYAINVRVSIHKKIPSHNPVFSDRNVDHWDCLSLSLIFSPLTLTTSHLLYLLALWCYDTCYFTHFSAHLEILHKHIFILHHPFLRAEICENIWPELSLVMENVVNNTSGCTFLLHVYRKGFFSKIDLSPVLAKTTPLPSWIK